MSTLTHLVGVAVSLLGLAVLVWLTRDERPKMLSLLVYGLSQVVLYTASSLLHGVKLPEERRMWLNRLDHAAIFLLIAGTYTPIIHAFMPKMWRPEVLTAVWLVALAGVVYKLTSRRIHGFLNTSIYLLLSWGGAVPLVLALNVAPRITAGGLALLLLGGLVYSLGYVVYYRQRPDPWPNVFGHHELWHLFVLGGGFSHFLFMLLYVVPA